MAAKLALTDMISLPNSTVKMPRLGFGVYQSHAATCIASCQTALTAGYRHIDSAQYYANEVQVGEAVRQSKLPRDSIFVTTKILGPAGGPEGTYKRISDSVDKIGLDGYVDLFLIHSPSSGAKGRKEMWQALEKAHAEGKCKSIGVSNFGVSQIEEMKEYAKVWPPHVNQIELHPWCQQRTTDAYCQKHGIVVQAYCPLVRNEKAKDPTLTALADKYKVSTAQILIRYCLQKNWVPLPKSDTPSRIKSNADVYGFGIDEDDMGKLDSLDQGSRGALVQAAKN
ncbi:MAG: hypothetical protein M4579_007408 [Chaenotheca gracillima]|nr:MAG: hypothetical protein M4579_007408 [Chaenotheca gracillima]